MSKNHRRRILAIDPGTRHMGVAVLDGDRLIYHTVKDFTQRRPADALIKATRRAILRLIEVYKPDTLVHEKTFFIHSKRSALLQVQEAEIQRVGTMRGLTVVGYSPTAVRRRLCGDGQASKRDVATRLVMSYPELARYYSDRQSWKRKYWGNMFDALAVGVVCHDGLNAGDR